MLDDLNPQQRAAACYQGGAKNLLVVAGAGTGKTKTMVARVHHLIRDQQIPSSEILCLTFTNKAANEMLSRLRSQPGMDLEGLTACTFHSFCIQLIRRVPNSFDYDSVPMIIDAANQKLLFNDSLASVLDEVVVAEEDKAKVPKVDAILREYSYARNAMRPVEQQFFEYLTYDTDMLSLALKVVERYEAQKASYRYADFDDILYRFVEVAEKKPRLAEAISNLFTEVLVDELQDTNPLQYRILKLLGAGRSRLFAVGDPAQSIYAFRGADFKSIYRFSELFPDSERLLLSTNYRSHQEILDVANRLLDASSYSYDNALSAFKGASGNRAKLRDFANAIDEGTFIARDIAAYQEGGGSLNDIFIITRSAFSAREVEGSLKRFNIPYEFVGGMSINKTAHVQDMLALLRLARNSRDKLSCIRYLSLFPGVGAKTASRGYLKIAEAPSPEEVAKIIRATVKKSPELAAGLYEAVIDALATGGNPVHTLLARGLETLIREVYSERPDYRLADLRAVGDLYGQYRGDIETFIADFTLEPDMTKTELPEEEEDKVTLITAHSAKGLERKRCYVIGVTPGTFPSRRSIGNMESEEEERRVMYVAVTRAMEDLIMTRSVEHAHHVFMNAVTEVDMVRNLIPLMDYEKGRRGQSQQVHGLAGLQDIF